MFAGVAMALLLVGSAIVEANERVPRSAAISNLSEGTSNVLGDLISAINPVYLVIIGVLLAAGCAFELAYGSRAARPTTHVASRNAPFALAP